MAIRQFPQRPNLDQLKRQAKDLLHAARSGDPQARARFRMLPAFARVSDADLSRAVIALHPGVARANFYTALVAGDAGVVDAWLAEEPPLTEDPVLAGGRALAITAGGPRGWLPIHYVCHSAMAGDPVREAGLVASARRLLALGADANTRFPWVHHGVQRPVLWGAVAATRSLPLARVLLDAGADPNDGVTLPLAAGASDIAALELLAARGANPNTPWATDGAAPLYAILHWSGKPDGARWLLDHGADPDPVFPANGETPLHVVAANGDLDLVDALVRRGADVARPRGDGRTPYAIAELNGHREMAEWLAAHGAARDLTAVDRLVAACSRGDRAVVDAMLEAQPTLASQIGDEHYGPFYRAAEHNDVAALDAMLACGFDPDRPDESIGKTSLHLAAMEGWPDAVRLLLARGASVTVRDREFRATPLVWAAEGSRTWREGRDHVAVGRLLVDAGSPADWDANDEPSEEITEIVNAWRAARLP